MSTSAPTAEFGPPPPFEPPLNRGLVVVDEFQSLRALKGRVRIAGGVEAFQGAHHLNGLQPLRAGLGDLLAGDCAVAWVRAAAGVAGGVGGGEVSKPKLLGGVLHGVVAPFRVPPGFRIFVAKGKYVTALCGEDYFLIEHQENPNQLIFRPLLTGPQFDAGVEMESVLGPMPTTPGLIMDAARAVVFENE